MSSESGTLYLVPSTLGDVAAETARVRHDLEILDERGLAAASSDRLRAADRLLAWLAERGEESG